MEISVIGAGHVGLISGACFADLGHSVIMVDNDAVRIANLKRGIMPFYEPGLEEIVRRNTLQGRLQFTTDYAAVQSALACFIAVPTPLDSTKKKADLSYLKKAIESIVIYLQKGS